MIAVLKYNAGNIKSVENALERIGRKCVVTDDPELLQQAEKVIIPGVGHAGSAMSYLKEKGLDQVIKNLKQPVLGICLGLQLMCEFSEEGETKCLGIFNSQVKRFPALDKVPHMGWNNINFADSPIFKNVSSNADVYFVHSYYAGISRDTIASCGYIVPFSAAMRKNNFYAVQFHPEKSAKEGELILKNFLNL
jgi:imidazole glycerol-phosphate synthase subunit HisH